MKNVLLQAAIKLKKAAWGRWAIRCLAMLVAFCTTYVLILPALTLEGEPECGIEAHAHTESCYHQEPVTVLGCGLEERVATEPAADGSIPLLPEEEHIHTDSCMVPTGEVVQTLSCQLQEHSHTELCYPQLQNEESEYLCGMGPHSHVDSCLDAEGSLICSIPEHTHEDACIQPEADPLTPEQRLAVESLLAQLAELPDPAAVTEAMVQLSEDPVGLEALRQELMTRLEGLQGLYESLDDRQKEAAGVPVQLDELQAVLGTEKQLPELTDDSAVVTGLAETAVEVITPAEPAYTIRPENSLCNGDLVIYTLQVDTASYYTDVQYGKARVKIELVLPVTAEKAAFDLSQMSWLEDSLLTEEIRMINGTDTACQVLTGYKLLTGVSGSFTEQVAVTVSNMRHGEALAVIVSAAMEHGTWEGLCENHGVPETLTIVTESKAVYAPAPEQLQEETGNYYSDILTQLETAQTDITESLEALRQEMAESYAAGALSEDRYSQLHERAIGLSGVNLQTVAEPSAGDGWVWMDFGSEEQVLGTAVQTEVIPAKTALPQAISKSLNLDSNSQIPDNGWGGENSADGVIWVSKTIEGTPQENVFDITLQIITKEEVNEVYKEPDMAVVIVMDISNTMTSVFSGEKTVTRYDAAMTAAQHFMEQFAEQTGGISRVGYVAFNTHAHEVFGMQACGTAAQARTLANTMRTKTAAIMTDAAKATADGRYASSHDRFTNIQAGLKMAQDMLAGVNNQHKYVIFLSDGFPTTYVKSGYKGYDPYTSTGTNGTNGVFYDRVMGVHCDYGTSYSDTAAIKARQMAVNMKKAGINIFSIGVDVAGQTIKAYHDDSVNRLKTSSTVERRESASYYNTTGYEIGTLHSEITRANPTAAQTAAMAQDFKDWLKGTASSGIGSGYYYDSTDLSGLEAAYGKIFAKILEMNAESAHLDWVATDPMPDMGVHELETVEFIGFWDVDNVLRQALTGESKDNALYENTATFDTTASTIHWDLKNSGYQSVSLGNGKNYMCALKYRVRLRNENQSFVERTIYDTNDTTFLHYRVIEVVNGVTGVSDRKYIEFPIPKVFGYLSELNFKKISPTGAGLPGAGFTLTHDTENCGTCRGDGVGHVALPVYEATSGADGMVNFTNIPSGHHYILTETKAPEGFILTSNTYKVHISYDSQTVTVLDADGNPLEWTATVKNDAYYTLPSTGGVGTHSYTLGGLLIVAAALLYAVALGRKRQRKENF